ncbi:MAG: hypothetical protein JSS30_02625 [Verrucomicrobia bacterium]|nr:hypothetical protein [Verrucomicrobiota bacterium]
MSFSSISFSPQSSQSSSFEDVDQHRELTPGAENRTPPASRNSQELKKDTQSEKIAVVVARKLNMVDLHMMFEELSVKK